MPTYRPLLHTETHPDWISESVHSGLDIRRSSIPTIRATRQSSTARPQVHVNSAALWHRCLMLLCIAVVLCAITAVVLYSPAPEVGVNVLIVLLSGGGLAALVQKMMT
ncbi:hypothetical protein SAMN04490220_1153 [Rhodococcus jostii]|uniref:Uncharacterized protein n=1 Tax=Rhodococcus jostii TaxID=132919 RepID=A0A1H4QYT3_RHOJO|nr:hypothetical protein SAMN04490220_1153 [Rhodococcus jostii]